MSLKAIEPLKQITKSELRKLLNTLRKNENKSSISAQYYLENYCNWVNKYGTTSDVLSKIMIYIPCVRVEEYSTFIVVDLSDQFYSNIIIPFTFEQHGAELIECLTDTKFISWTNAIVIASQMDQTFLAFTKTFLQEKKLKILSEDEFSYYLLPKEMKLDYVVPSDVKVTELYEFDSDLLNKYWTYGTDKTLKGIKLLIKWNGGLGLRKASNNELIGWVLLNNHFAIGMLQVIETEMRKGYGELLVKLISTKFVKEHNMDPLTCISDVNDKSLNLFKKLGFKPFGGVTYIIVEEGNLPVKA